MRSRFDVGLERKRKVAHENGEEVAELWYCLRWVCTLGRHFITYGSAFLRDSQVCQSTVC